MKLPCFGKAERGSDAVPQAGEPLRRTDRKRRWPFLTPLSLCWGQAAAREGVRRQGVERTPPAGNGIGATASDRVTCGRATASTPGGLPLRSAPTRGYGPYRAPFADHRSGGAAAAPHPDITRPSKPTARTKLRPIHGAPPPASPPPPDGEDVP